MNSVTIVREFRMNKSPTEKAAQNFPKRTLISRRGDAGYRPEAHDRSRFTIRTGMAAAARSKARVRPGSTGLGIGRVRPRRRCRPPSR